jgi:NAD(P)-dependent dehydrogenase (short-subunit alcohol dehydrogenase family)
MKPFQRAIKRLVDLILSALGLALLSPLSLFTALLIKLDSKGPALFRQTRVGKNGKPLTCYKFRTMYVNVPDIRNPDGSTFNAEDDPWGHRSNSPAIKEERMANLDGQTALVTGSSRGIGRAIAKELAACGANLVINYNESESQALGLLEEIATLGVQGEVIRANVSVWAQVEAMVDRALACFGTIEILVNNAGINRDKTFKNMSAKHWDEVLQTDLYGVYYCTKALVPHMIDQKYGRIVNIASIVGQTGAFGQANYAAAKAGVIGFTKSVALEVARHGITVNAVCPGYTVTDMLAAVPEDIREQIRVRIPLGRFAQPEEIARVVRFLVCEGDYITGQCININGGLYM